jgi:hypothetical protein
MTVFSSLPAPLKHLWAKLEAVGFWQSEEEHSESFGDAFAILMRNGLCIRFVRDRGQWFVDLSGPNCQDWFSPMVWVSYLDGFVTDLSTPSIEEQVTAIEDRLEEIQHAVMNNADLLERLQEGRRLRANKRRALGPDLTT